MPLRLRKNDMVMIMSGDSRGQTGKIIKVLPKKNRALVEARNIVKRHTKPNRKVQQGGIIEKEASIHLSNLMLLDPKSGKPTRVGMKVIESGDKTKRVRFSKKAKELID